VRGRSGVFSEVRSPLRLVTLEVLLRLLKDLLAKPGTCGRYGAFVEITIRQAVVDCRPTVFSKPSAALDSRAECSASSWFPATAANPSWKCARFA
jgi:hypothetical protein